MILIRSPTKPGNATDPIRAAVRPGRALEGTIGSMHPEARSDGSHCHWCCFSEFRWGEYVARIHGVFRSTMNRQTGRTGRRQDSLPGKGAEHLKRPVYEEQLIYRDIAYVLNKASIYSRSLTFHLGIPTASVCAAEVGEVVPGVEFTPSSSGTASRSDPLSPAILSAPEDCIGVPSCPERMTAPHDLRFSYVVPVPISGRSASPPHQNTTMKGPCNVKFPPGWPVVHQCDPDSAACEQSVQLSGSPVVMRKKPGFLMTSADDRTGTGPPGRGTAEMFRLRYRTGSGRSDA